ncbi:GreA/GreB family elongation factor [Meiothermus granaticius]|uniref:Transcription inhibitor protein Gfh1 n=1 Tax=Meiothermus granaticius NBRC 107808 TaxID=1227551 RepID=A0A399F9H7_9DEIN|nr:GreA/GreB family elongation factor [Meiothermus granaticius]MCL6525895.1 GreA/GreB family elongation factor [Thermaceae bacterium]RIH91909.1 Transcription inhibitor protein Gfh1 [Meiothermus granaticius NBRC 107808]GEM85471.1 transcription inhibitor protein Gfh1 [Meiothermus granaticius NBRC 107808]
MAREVKLTKSGYERLVAELEQERARLQDATRILQELMESSDDYDDSGLEDAKREKARIESRIDSLTDTLSRAEIIEEEKGGSNVISLGTIVSLKAKEGDHLEVQVVAPAEASVLERPMKISDESPMGRALLGQKVGAKVMLDTPKGRREFKVEAVKH